MPACARSVGCLLLLVQLWLPVVARAEAPVATPYGAVSLPFELHRHFTHSLLFIPVAGALRSPQTSWSRARATSTFPSSMTLKIVRF